MPQVDTSAFNEHAEFVLRDENGQPFLVIGHEKVTLVDVNGEISECARENAILLVDGVMWTPQMLKWANPVLLTVCSVCRCATISLFQPKRSSHGLLSVRNARNCVGCGCVLCAQHRGWTNDGWRCRSCREKHGFKEAIKRLFFREEV